MRNEIIRQVVRKYTEPIGFPAILLEAHQVRYYDSLIQFISNRTDSYQSIQRYIHRQANPDNEGTVPVTDRRKRRKGTVTHVA